MRLTKVSREQSPGLSDFLKYLNLARFVILMHFKLKGRARSFTLLKCTLSLSDFIVWSIFGEMESIKL